MVGRPEMTPLRSALAASVVLAGVIGLSVGRTQPVEGGPDPSTIQGQTQMQNDEYQRQAQERNQQNQQQDRQQDQMNQQSQQQQSYGQRRGYDQGSGARGPSFGAIFVGAANPSVIRYSYNFDSRAKARAAAMSACFQATGAVCKEALVFNNSCGALAISQSGVWAARSAPLFPQAIDEARDACKSAGRQECTVRKAYCLPFDN